MKKKAQKEAIRPPQVCGQCLQSVSLAFGSYYRCPLCGSPTCPSRGRGTCWDFREDDDSEGPGWSCVDCLSEDP